MEKSKKWDLASIATIPLTMTLANSMLIPVLPDMQKALGISALKASLFITVYAVVAIVFIPVTGYLSDRFGRKRIIIPGLLLVAAAGAFAGWAASSFKAPYSALIAARMVQGLGAAASFPIVLPLVGDLFRREEDVSTGLGIVETSNTFGKVLSPIVGSALALWVWYAPFFAIPAFSLLSFVMVAFFVKTPKSADSSGKPSKRRVRQQPQQAEPGRQQQSPKAFVRQIAVLFREHGRWLYATFAVGGIAMFVVFGSLFYLSETLEERGIHGIAKGAVLAIPLAALCTASFLAGKWIGKSKPRMKWSCFGGLACATVALSALALTGKTGSIWLVGMLALAFAGIGIGLPGLDALLTEGIDKKERGTITSFYSSMRFVGVAAGPPLGAVLIGHSAKALFYTLAAACLADALLTLFAIRPDSGTAKAGTPDRHGTRSGKHRQPAK